MLSTALEQHRDLCVASGADACLVVAKGRVVQSWTGPRYREPMFAMSSTKSVTAILVGMLVAEGKIRSIDQPVCDFITEWCDGERESVTLRHLLTMTSGLPPMHAEGVGSKTDKNAYVIGLKPVAPAGKTWAYSNEGAQLLSPILDRAAGEPIQNYARRKLFEPLGMTKTRLHIDSKGHAWTYADMETTPREFARIGELILANGTIDGVRIVPEAWIRQMLTPSPLRHEYGFLWWLHESGFVATLGYLDTNMYVVPDAQLVVVRMQSKPAKGAQPYWPAALDVLQQLRSGH